VADPMIEAKESNRFREETMSEPHGEEKQESFKEILDKWAKEPTLELGPSKEFRARVMDKIRAEDSKQRQWIKEEEERHKQKDTQRER
jgi:hypothetical protein